MPRSLVHVSRTLFGSEPFVVVGSAAQILRCQCCNCGAPMSRDKEASSCRSTQHIGLQLGPEFRVASIKEHGDAVAQY